MSRPAGQITDTEPLELWEYELIIAKLETHWQLFYALLWETGARASEALNLTRKDFENMGVWITSAKRKDHLRVHQPLSLDLYNRFQAYFQFNHRQKIFYNSATGRVYTESAAWLALKKACAEAGMRPSIHPHSFRHGLGTRARQAGYDIATVQRLLRHKDMRSTERYFKATKTEVEAAFRELNK
uniref:Putative site-specific tyrosine recombinase n=1 Tax=viral metagenome TaxID=1070528 RepID=A0A6M3LKL5_9ZZZZ